MTITEVAEKAGVSVNAVRMWISPGLNGGKLKTSKVGRRVFISEEEFERFKQVREGLR